MSTINFTQFASPTDSIPNNDYVVGYHKVKISGGETIDQEAKWNFYKLSSEILPQSGLGSRLHQIRMLATKSFEHTFSCAAVTKAEEVICWGRNANVSVGTGHPFNQGHIKFGAGFSASNKAPAWQPVVVPFLLGTPESPQQQVYNLQQAGLRIEQLWWDSWGAFCRLNDGSVWVKGLLGASRDNGLDSSVQVPDTLGTQPWNSHYFSSGFYRIPAARFTIGGGSAPLSAAYIAQFPIGLNSKPMGTNAVQAATFGHIYQVIDQYGDLHLFGCGHPLSPLFGSQGKYFDQQPQNITYDVPALQQNIREVQITGNILARPPSSAGVGNGISVSTNHTLRVITKDNKIFSRGFTGFGNLGDGIIGYRKSTGLPITGSTQTGAVLNDTNFFNVQWVQARRADDPNQTADYTLVDNAQRFLDCTFQEYVAGYISTIVNTGTGDRNYIYLVGTNPVNQTVNNPPILIGKGPANVGKMEYTAPYYYGSDLNAYYRRVYSSVVGDPVIKGIINNSLTCVVITGRGRVLSAGYNPNGEGGRDVTGRLPLGADFGDAKFEYSLDAGRQNFGPLDAGLNAGFTGLTAIDIEWDRSAIGTFTNADTTGSVVTVATNAAFGGGNCVAVKCLQQKIGGGTIPRYALAGYRTFTSQANSYLENTTSYQLFPVKEGVYEILMGGGPVNIHDWYYTSYYRTGHQYSIILTETGRVYGVGLGPWGLLQDTYEYDKNRLTYGGLDNSFCPVPTVIF